MGVVHPLWVRRWGSTIMNSAVGAQKRTLQAENRAGYSTAYTMQDRVTRITTRGARV